MNLKGLVNNSGDGLHVLFNASEAAALEFYNRLLHSGPRQARIEQQVLEKTAFQSFDRFEIQESVNGTRADLMLTPDFALCEACRLELKDPANRRYQYPFITCTQCGPRYSVITRLPYDRENTAMERFAICEACGQEYQDPSDRRYYSQTNSCQRCGVQISLHTKDGKRLLQREELAGFLNTLLSNKKIVAVKGIGGYLVMADACDPELVLEIRKRKKRPSKPFALLYPDMETIRADFEVSVAEEKALTSGVAPIVLLKRKPVNAFNLPCEFIAPGLSTLGIMLPYAPILELLASTFKRPLIATSANISDSPIIYKDDDAIENLFSVADCIISHNRDIVVPQDDSVIRFSRECQQQIILRRSRGLAPSFFDYTTPVDSTSFACGAMMKSSFTYTSRGKVYISQYLGNTDRFEAQQAYENTANHLLNLFSNPPENILTDKHPAYFSHHYAKKIAGKDDRPVTFIQHHKAHAAAVLGENGLTGSRDPVLCVVWDGTGWGDDGHIWGGEFFVYQQQALHRAWHIAYYPVIARDKMAREPRISALALANDKEYARKFLRQKFQPAEWDVYTTLLDNGISMQTSSVGRLFDAVASMLGICDRQTFEGEAAIKLEELAEAYNSRHTNETVSPYPFSLVEQQIVVSAMIDAIIRALDEGADHGLVALKFHQTLAHIIFIVAQQAGLTKIAFSGGAFQNGLLIDLLQKALKPAFELYFHHQLSPNDENISFGQLVYFDNNIDGCSKGANSVATKIHSSVQL